MIKQHAQQLLTVQEAATFFKVKEPTIQRWCRQGRIPAIRRGKSWRIPWDTTIEVEGSMQAPADDALLAPPSIAAPAGPGWHGLMVVDHDLALEEALAPLRLHVHSLNDLRLVRFSLSLRSTSDGKASLPALKAAWEQRLASFNRNDRVVILVVNDEDVAFQSEADSDEWEEYLNLSVRDRPLTIICVRDDRWGVRHRLEVRPQSFAAHDMIWFQSRSSSYSLMPDRLGPQTASGAQE